MSRAPTLAIQLTALLCPHHLGFTAPQCTRWRDVRGASGVRVRNGRGTDGLSRATLCGESDVRPAFGLSSHLSTLASRLASGSPPTSCSTSSRPAACSPAGTQASCSALALWMNAISSSAEATCGHLVAPCVPPTSLSPARVPMLGPNLTGGMNTGTPPGGITCLDVAPSAAAPGVEYSAALIFGTLRSQVRACSRCGGGAIARPRAGLPPRPSQ
jgi:hypothetical protein